MTIGSEVRYVTSSTCGSAEQSTSSNSSFGLPDLVDSLYDKLTVALLLVGNLSDAVRDERSKLRVEQVQQSIYEAGVLVRLIVLRTSQAF